MQAVLFLLTVDIVITDSPQCVNIGGFVCFYVKRSVICLKFLSIFCRK